MKYKEQYKTCVLIKQSDIGIGIFGIYSHTQFNSVRKDKTNKNGNVFKNLSDLSSWGEDIKIRINYSRTRNLSKKSLLYRV